MIIVDYTYELILLTIIHVSFKCFIKRVIYIELTEKCSQSTGFIKSKSHFF